MTTMTIPRAAMPNREIAASSFRPGAFSMCSFLLSFASHARQIEYAP